MNRLKNVLGQGSISYSMIIRNYANGSLRVLTPADNRRQTTDHGPQLTQLNYNPYFIPLLA